MEKNIKDYLHLYLGCEVECSPQHSPYGNTRFRLDCVDFDNRVRVFQDADDMWWVHAEAVKPILRSLSDMTDEEEKYNKELDTFHSSNRIIQRQREAERTLWLLKRGFDLFGLIEAGLAINKTKVLTNNI